MRKGPGRGQEDGRKRDDFVSSEEPERERERRKGNQEKNAGAPLEIERKEKV